MLADRYGLALSTQSSAARDAFVEATDLTLTLYPGAVAAYDRALAADPAFTLAHVGTARARQLAGDMAGARAALAQAETDAGNLSPREASHLAVFRHLLAGQSDAALAAVRTHLADWPLDAMVLSTTANQIGLIGLSGLAGREQALTDFLAAFAPHYGDDWWFNAHYAMALSETSQQPAARKLIERSMARHPANAYGAHALAHVCYEEGERDAAIAFIRSWLPGYGRGPMFGHLSWHLALFELQAANPAEGFRLYDDAFGAADYPGPAMLKLVDAAAFLWRAELAGHGHDAARWQALHEFAHRNFPRPGMSMCDWHVGLIDAANGDTNAVNARAVEMEEMARAGHYPAGPGVPAVMRAFAAFQQRDYPAAIAAIEPMLGERERIGGSRAQVDLVEFTLLKSYLALGRLADARHLLAARRPGPARIPVAGLESVH